MELIEKWKSKKREKELLNEIDRLNEQVHYLEMVLQWERIEYASIRKLNIQEVKWNCIVPKEEEELHGDKAIEEAKETIACNILNAIRTLIEYKLRENTWRDDKIYTGSLWVGTQGKQLKLD